MAPRQNRTNLIISPLECATIWLPIIDQQPKRFRVENDRQVGDRAAKVVGKAIRGDALPGLPEFDVPLGLVRISERADFDPMPPVVSPTPRPTITILKRMDGVGQSNRRNER